MRPVAFALVACFIGGACAAETSEAARRTAVAEAFAAGIVTHARALTAVAAPNPVSYIRLTPNRWAQTWAYVADRDREASLRVCPLLDLPGADHGREFNIEFRPADAADSPWLALGAVVWAGVDGIRQG
jgi:glutamine synthetase